MKLKHRMKLSINGKNGLIIDIILLSHYFLQVTSPDGGWITKSNLSLKINPMDRNKDVLCYAVNSALGETVVEKHTVAVLCKY